MAKQELVTKDEETGLTKAPDFIKMGDRRGMEDMNAEDIMIPRLALAQDTSKQTKRSEPAHFIEGLEVGMFFNSLTKKIYGPGPLYFYIVKRDKPRFVEFIPRSEGGGIRDPKVAPDDPRTEFGPGGEPPIATKFLDYLILLDPIDKDEPLASMIALSLKSTQLKKAKTLNGLIMLRNRPLFSGRYEVRSIDDSNKKGNFKNFEFKNAGWANSQELLDSLEATYEALKTTDTSTIIHTDAHEPDPAEGGGDTSFDPDKM